MTGVAEPLLPPDPEGLETVHQRDYQVHAYRLTDRSVLVRGAVRDLQPLTLYLGHELAGGAQPITVHQMLVEMEVSFPSGVIARLDVSFSAFPHGSCSSIAPAFGGLVGTSLLRGFAKTLRSTNGGPLGCAHVTALLSAVSAAAVQWTWAMSIAARRDAGATPEEVAEPTPDRIVGWRPSYDTCHVWASDGPLVSAIERGGAVPVPLTVERRLAGIRDAQAQPRADAR